MILIISIFFLVIGIVLIILGSKKINEANSIQEIKEQSLQEEQRRKDKLLDEITLLTDRKQRLEEEERLNKQRFQEFKDSYSEQLDLYKQNISYAGEQYIDTLEKDYTQAEINYEQKKKDLQSQQEQIEKDIESAGTRLTELKTQISAATEAQLREREKEEKLDFYKLSVSPIELSDIEKLESVKLTLHNPTILSKLIWTTYFQKQTTELCNRILGVNTVCGIYKITDLKTKQCYIGQSVDLAKRWKDHIKCGLGIDTPVTNKLYNAMQRDKVWNFTFELLEKCPRDKLDEAEKRWIEIYQSNKIGLNVTKGGSGK